MSFARILFAPSVVASSAFLYSSHSRPLACDSSSSSSFSSPSFSSSSSSTGSSSITRASSGPLIDPHQFATGSVLGIAAGLLFKRLGKLFFVVIGGSYLLLRALGASSVPGLNQIRIPWAQARQFLLNRSGLGDAATNKVGAVGESPIVALLTRDLTFKLSFLTTFLIGMVNT